MSSLFRLARKRSGETRQREVDAELRFHIDERIEELVAGGMPRAQAEREVRARFGDVATVRAELESIDATIDRRRSRSEWMATMARQARLALRALVRRPTFSAVAVATLALGCGAATAVFTLVDAILLRPLPYDAPEQLVDVTHSATISGHLQEMRQSSAAHLFYEAHNTVFANVAAYHTTNVNVVMPGSAGTGTESGAERVAAASVSASLFPTLRVSPYSGRLFLAGEDRVNAPKVVVISEGLWRRKFGGDPSVLGRSLVVHGEPRQIVGILPVAFAFPSPETQIWFPSPFDPATATPGNFEYNSVARLKDNVSIERAKEELDRLLPRIPEEYPGDVPPAMWKAVGVRAVLQPLQDAIVGNSRQLLWILLASAGFVLLIACANVASLFMVRAEDGQHELAVRRALGAGSAAAASQYITEALLLALGGGMLGMALATVAVRSLRLIPSTIDLPRLHEVTIGIPSFLFAFATLTFCAIAVCVFPLLRARAVSVAAVLKDAGRSSMSSVRKQRARSALVVAQVALAMVLVAASGLMARSFMRLRNVDPGFNAEHVLIVRVALSNGGDASALTGARFFTRILDEARTLPGVKTVALSSWVPLTDYNDNGAIAVEGQEVPVNAVPPVHEEVYASDSLFAAMGTPLLEGRTFSPLVPTRGSDEVIVSRAFAKRYWRNKSAVGKRIRQGITGSWQMVVGVVGDVHLKSLQRPAEEAVYVPLLSPNRGHPGQLYSPTVIAIVIRAQGDPQSLIGPVRALVKRIDPALPTFDERPLTATVQAASARTRFTMLLLGIASAVALLLGAVGIYGVMAYGVSLRQREIGVRMALGARPSDVGWMVSRQGIALAGTGVVIGLAGALGTTRLLRGLLYDVSPTDPLTLGATCGVLLLMALLASWLPARRAAALQPIGALRGD
jgi:putative ABC transport system permease protein